VIGLACLLKYQRNGRPGASIGERRSGRREPDPESPNQRPVVVIRPTWVTRYDIPPARKRKQATSRKDLIRAHMAELVMFRQVIEAGRVKALVLPRRSPNLNACAERWVGSVKEECLGKMISLGEGSLRRALSHLRSPLS